MVTARQFGRGVSSFMRAVERDNQRAHRQRLAHEKAALKHALLADSADAAGEYEDFVSYLTEGHRLAFSRYDWRGEAEAVSPPDACAADTQERAAKGVLEGYNPTWLSQRLGMAEKRRTELAALVAEGRRKDEEAFRAAEGRVTERRRQIEFAQAVLRQEAHALARALEDKADLTGVAAENLRAIFISGRVFALVDGFEIDDLPMQSVSLLQSGRASVKPLAAAKRSEMHRDNVCSVALKVAVEFLQALPVEAVEVVVLSDLLDRGTGHIEAQPVLYGRITAQALGALNLQMADAYPAAERLGLNLNWSRKDGLKSLELEPFGLPEDLLGEAAEAG